MKFVLQFPETPPTYNRLTGGGRGGKPWPYIKAKKLWEGNFQIELMRARVPRGLIRVEASAMLRFPTVRKRDEGNFRVLLEKALGDTLVSGGWLPDDTPDHYKFGSLSFEEERGKPLTTVTLEVVK